MPNALPSRPGMQCHFRSENCHSFSTQSIRKRDRQRLDEKLNRLKMIVCFCAINALF